MIKTLIASGAVASAAVALASPALAGTYVNVENNAGYQDGYQGSTTDLHVGYEGGDATYGFYIQGGPAYAQPDGGDAELGFSGKMGIGADVSESFGVYGEVSVAKFDDVDAGYGLKVGGKYKF